MKDSEIERLIRSLDTESKPPEGLRERVLARTLEPGAAATVSPLEALLFRKPLYAAAAIAAAITGVLWGLAGVNFTEMMNLILG